MESFTTNLRSSQVERLRDLSTRSRVPLAVIVRQIVETGLDAWAERATSEGILTRREFDGTTS